jgi:hypothetical protein
MLTELGLLVEKSNVCVERARELVGVIASIKKGKLTKHSLTPCSSLNATAHTKLQSSANGVGRGCPFAVSWLLESLQEG